MLCSSIKLTDRREFRQDTTPKRNRSTMLEEKLFMKSDYYHRYRGALVHNTVIFFIFNRILVLIFINAIILPIRLS